MSHTPTEDDRCAEDEMRKLANARVKRTDDALAEKGADLLGF